eukprot:scaffold294_cov281-Pinguiococcus_pyrenoidosus.AAC.9
MSEKSDRTVQIARMLEGTSMPTSPVIPITAGIESTAKTTSEISTQNRHTIRGVASNLPSFLRKKRSPSRRGCTRPHTSILARRTTVLPLRSSSSPSSSAPVRIFPPTSIPFISLLLLSLLASPSWQ